MSYRHTLLGILMVKKLLESFVKKNCKKLIKKSLELKKLLREKVIKHMLNGKSYDNLFDSWIDKKDMCIQNELFS